MIRPAIATRPPIRNAADRGNQGPNRPLACAVFGGTVTPSMGFPPSTWAAPAYPGGSFLLATGQSRTPMTIGSPGRGLEAHRCAQSQARQEEERGIGARWLNAGFTIRASRTPGRWLGVRRLSAMLDPLVLLVTPGLCVRAGRWRPSVPTNSGLLARAALALGEDLRVDRDRKRNVAADEDRMEHMRPVAPDIVFGEHAIAAQIRDQHRRPFSLERRPAVGAVEADHAGDMRLLLVLRSYLQIVDQMPRGRVAALPAPGVERADLVVSPELVVADREQAVVHIKFVGFDSGIEIDVIPVVRLQAVEREPQRRFIAIMDARHGGLRAGRCTSG